MNYIQKLARHVVASTKQTAVGSWVVAYDTKVNTAVKRLKLKREKGRYGEPNQFHDKFPVSIAIMSYICYAALNRCTGKYYDIGFPTSADMRKRYPKLTTEVDRILKENPRWVVFNARAMHHEYHKIVKNDIPNWGDLSKEARIVEEILNIIWEVWPWASEHHGGHKRKLTYKMVMKYGFIADASKLSMQRIFAQGMVLRYPLEHHSQVAKCYTDLREFGFTKEQAAQLVYFIRSVDENGLGVPDPGDGHDFACTRYVTREQFKAIMQGCWMPAWDNGDQPWVKQGAHSTFKLFKATSPEVAKGKELEGLKTIQGEGWDKRTLIDLNKLKELGNE